MAPATLPVLLDDAVHRFGKPSSSRANNAPPSRAEAPCCDRCPRSRMAPLGSGSRLVVVVWKMCRMAPQAAVNSGSRTRRVRGGCL
ncbi:hypothetical protein E2562_007871 [Oryza meyeriana var. granulata]|uniref:Uncharacterized protein n=1 Tax=Oryza meyeriana var. granulata TaxID=110450 RepID=A0A6G1F5I0_9ORYZ|nr:hypothetical protein E2562_007871 [Oryza meyeriana var. granulata]